MNDPVDVFECGEDMVIEIVELSGIDAGEPLGGEVTETDRAPFVMGDEFEMESGGGGTRSPAPKGNGAGPSIRP